MAHETPHGHRTTVLEVQRDRGNLTTEAPWAYRFVATMFAFLFAPFVQIRIERMGAAARERTAVVVCNHRSMFDFVMGLVAFRRIARYPRVVVASEYFDRRFAGWALRRAGAVPLDRDDPTAYYDTARRVLDAGVPILILPEGKLSGTPGDPTSMGEFKRGAARLAAKCDVPVWALGHVGTEYVWPRGRAYPRLNPLRRRRVLLLGAEDIVAMSGDEKADT